MHSHFFNFLCNLYLVVLGGYSEKMSTNCFWFVSNGQKFQEPKTKNVAYSGIEEESNNNIILHHQIVVETKTKNK